MYVFAASLTYYQIKAKNISLLFFIMMIIVIVLGLILFINQLNNQEKAKDAIRL